MKIMKDINVESLQEQAEQLKQIISSKKMKMEVVVAGNVKAGKSTLINALFNDENLCETGVVRTTTDNMQFEADNFLIMDTPGINANEEDTLVAYSGYNSADFFLFVHNLVDGEFLLKELEFLQNLQQHFVDEEQFVRNVTIVLTNAHQLEDEIVENVRKRIETQLAKVSTQLFTIVSVDSLSYLSAMKEKKLLLAEGSNIPVLLNILDEKSKYFVVHIREERGSIFNVQKDQILERANQLLLKKGQSLEKIENQSVDVAQIEKLIRKIEQLVNDVRGKIACDQFLGNHRGNGFAHVEMVSKMWSSYEYSSPSRAQAAGLNVFRERIHSKAEKFYIRTRNELINHYRDLLPCVMGDKSVMSRQQKEVEYMLNETKKELVSLVEIFDLSAIQMSQVTLNITIEKINDIDELRTASYVHATGFEYDYNIEPASWYETFINYHDRTEYKKGLFGEREIMKYCYDLYEAHSDINKHLRLSVDSAHDSILSGFRPIYRNYECAINEQVKKITDVWINTLGNQKNKVMIASKKQQEKVNIIRNDIKQIQALTEEVRTF